MKTLKLDDTIAAISTPIGEGGIGIVRLSGKDSLKIADKIFVSKHKKRLSSSKTHTIHYGYIIENPSPITHHSSLIIDEVLLTIMKEPSTYTKEDIVEINCHSGIASLKKILELVLKKGARLAEPGEFTKRAFLNGRIDIMQAESVLDIIRSKTDLSLKASLNNLKGVFSKRINKLKDNLMNELAHLEALIDFVEERDIEKLTKKKVFSNLKNIHKTVEKLVSESNDGKILRKGIKTVICGSPNVGKSSLMNALLRESRAIVTEIPGTTRDTIEEVINIKGVPVVIVDTAGINDTDDVVEKEGVKRSHKLIDIADIIILVLDASRKINKNDKKIISRIKNKNNVVIVVNKKDLKRRIDTSYIKKTFPKSTITYISSLKSLGIYTLEDRIYDMIFKDRVLSKDSVTVSNERQFELLKDVLFEINNAISAFQNKVSLECVSVYIRSAIENLSEVLGDTITEDMLDRIFGEFCVGK